MSEEDEKQAVTDNPDADRTVQPEGADALDLDAVLAEYQEKPKKPEQTEKPDESNDEILEFVRQQKQETERARVKEALGETVKELKGELEVDDDLAEGYLRKRAADDPRIERAFNERDKNPAAWRGVLRGLQKDFHSKFEGPDRALSEDMGAARAAVRSASTKPPQDDFDPKKVVEMDPKEFAQYVDKLQRSG